jgi:hypothetical protein
MRSYHVVMFEEPASAPASYNTSWNVLWPLALPKFVVDLLKIMCSSRCAEPVLPGASFRDPT